MAPSQNGSCKAKNKAISELNLDGFKMKTMLLEFFKFIENVH